MMTQLMKVCTKYLKLNPIGKKYYLINFTTHYITSIKKVKEAGKQISIIKLKPYIAKIFTLTGLDKIFVIEVNEN